MPRQIWQEIYRTAENGWKRKEINFEVIDLFINQFDKSPPCPVSLDITYISLELFHQKIKNFIFNQCSLKKQLCALNFLITSTLWQTSLPTPFKLFCNYIMLIKYQKKIFFFFKLSSVLHEFWVTIYLSIFNYRILFIRFNIKFYFY